MTSYIVEYWNAIQSGEVIVGKWIRKQIRNLIRDMDDPRYIFDPTIAHKRMAFQEKFCLQSKKPYYNKPIKFMLWQRAWWD